ncbi:MAG: sulfate adenylyltransferase subunit 2 [Verrucomicrobia bacterium]|nr:sulfate adenylyltransferase subunit 2 [Verrucomicrobiota bacterium]
MTTPASASALYPHLEALESESIYILRETFRHFKKSAMLWSIGKDSCVMLWLARKAFLGHVPFPCVHVDTSYKIPEMIAFRDQVAREWKLDLVVGQNREALAAGRTFPNGQLDRVACCTALKRDPLAAVIAEKNYEAVLVGIRRDEEGTRAKERYFSPRNKNFEWDFRDQPPEFWGQFQTDFAPGTHLRVHPLLHWTELNVWEYIHRENIPLVSLYFAKEGRRYRSLGCAPCTGTVASNAASVPEIIEELRTTKIAERSTRAQDQESEDAFERLRASGYM